MKSPFCAIAVLLVMLGILAPPLTSPAQATSALVISQVYGGGGNSGATYTNDYIELFNRGATSVSLANLSVQYASATGTGNFGFNSTAITLLPSVFLLPDHYFLIQEDQGAGGTTPLPTPDVTDPTPIAISATGAKVALVNSTASLGCNGSVGQPCSAAQLALIIDLVGWGSANFFEGAAAGPATNNTTALFRKGGGLIDTDNNSTDFSIGAPDPRNTSVPAPATLLLLGSGFAGLSGIAWRRNRNKT